MRKDIKFILPLLIIICFFIGRALIYIREERVKEDILSPQEAGAIALNYINENFLENRKASLIKVEDIGKIYKITLKIDAEQYDSYITKDGKFFFPHGYEIKKKKGLSKREKPDVKLFVMSYCPFGLQAEKAFLPVFKLLRDKMTAGIYFVDYIMHGKKEIDENLRQYCIQKEQKEKYIDYLECFVENGDSKNCLSRAKIDLEKLKICILETDSKFKITKKYNNKDTWYKKRYPPFDIHKKLNEKYGISGSPTLVINDAVIVQSKRYCPSGEKECVAIKDFQRSPEKFKEIICQAFTQKPDECNQILSSKVASPGFGGEGESFQEGSCQ